MDPKPYLKVELGNGRAERRRHPNAGKSPSFTYIQEEFQQACAAVAASLIPNHTCGAGNLGKFQEKLRATQGVGLLWGPEFKPLLDPNFPTKGTTDTGKFIDLSRFLECANGGAFEWSTGSEEKARRSARERAGQGGAEEGTPLPELRFQRTNINLCLFQQFSVLRSWWARMECTHNCGFTARLVTGFTGRAIVSRALSRQPQAPVSPILQKLWTDTATAWGHLSGPACCAFRPSAAAQHADLYSAIHALQQKQAWRRAVKAAFGMMEYLVPSAAVLTSLCCQPSWSARSPMQ